MQRAAWRSTVVGLRAVVARANSRVGNMKAAVGLLCGPACPAFSLHAHGAFCLLRLDVSPDADGTWRAHKASRGAGCSQAEGVQERLDLWAGAE